MDGTGRLGISTECLVTGLAERVDEAVQVAATQLDCDAACAGRVIGVNLDALNLDVPFRLGILGPVLPPANMDAEPDVRRVTRYSRLAGLGVSAVDDFLGHHALFSAASRRLCAATVGGRLGLDLGFRHGHFLRGEVVGEGVAFPGTKDT